MQSMDWCSNDLPNGNISRTSLGYAILEHPTGDPHAAIQEASSAQATSSESAHLLNRKSSVMEAVFYL